MNIFEQLAENPELQFWATAGVVAVCMALGAFVVLKSRKSNESGQATAVMTEHLLNIIPIL